MIKRLILNLTLLIVFTFIFSEITFSAPSSAGSSTSRISPEECDQLSTDSSGKIDIWALKDADLDTIIECAAPQAAKTEEISPLQIFSIITDAIAYLAFALSIIAAIVAVIQIATSAGDKTKFQNALTLLKNAGLGLAISIAAYAILSAILTQIGFGDWQRSASSTPAPINQVSCGSGAANLADCRQRFCRLDSSGRRWVPTTTCSNAIADPDSFPAGFGGFCSSACR